MPMPGPRAAAAFVLAAGFASGAAAEELSFEPRGRVQIDLQHRDWAVREEDDADLYIRRLFLGAQGGLGGAWRYKLDLVLTPGIDTIGVDDAYIEYVADGWSLLIGEHKAAAPLGERISSLDTPFVERPSFVNAFGFRQRAGFAFLTGGESWSLALAAQGGSMNGAEGEGDVDESRAFSARFTFAPILDLDGGHILHLGAHARHRGQNDAPERVRVRPLNGRDTRWIDATSSPANRLDEDEAIGVELAYARGPFTLQSEYVSLEGRTPLGASREFSAYYVDIYWSLTGEARPYRPEQGVFSAAAPRAPLSEGGLGHWMVLARYDYAELSDGFDPDRGEQNAFALGLDWTPAEPVRFKLNYAYSEMDRTAGADDEAEIITLRAQLSF